MVVATCKDCIHYELCQCHRDCAEHFELAVEKFGCKQFKNKSKIIELPCDVFDFVFVIFEGKIHRGIVQNFNITVYDYSVFVVADVVILNFNIKTRDRIPEFRVSAVFDVNAGYENVSVAFLTREEAEKALEEREHDNT